MGVCLYLDGVMGVRSLPMVWMTLRPQTHRPTQMPTPPYSSNQIGVGALDITDPLSKTSHRATRGPIALLKAKEVMHSQILFLKSVNTILSTVQFNSSALPDIISSVSKRAKTGGENL